MQYLLGLVSSQMPPCTIEIFEDQETTLVLPEIQAVVAIFFE